ncbi:UNVERIFIED_CONTAM: hypothetical protein Sradi_5278300 [Sesamum radiatum]|uniref:Formiminotransferase N-terminal subdomain domain-containing protein n=1 Tax=Sesamum radiatum TaxID=300843 RepID=A0AAW2LP97_SESRA
MLLCCKVYISESRNKEALDLIERAAKCEPETIIVNKFMDHDYNRVAYTLVSYVAHDSIGCPIYTPLQQSAVAMAGAAYEAINLESHCGAHPRLGVIDDIVCHPLGRASLDEAAWLAKTIASDVGNRFQVPVYLYAAAHPTGKALETIRRELGYYRPNYMGNHWADVLAAKRIALMVSGRGGGLPTVQTLGLVHGEDTTEIACMLLEPNQIGADRVQKQVEMLAAQEGLDVEKGYFTDLSPEMIVERYMKLISADSFLN